MQKDVWNFFHTLDTLFNQVETFFFLKSENVNNLIENVLYYILVHQKFGSRHIELLWILWFVNSNKKDIFSKKLAEPI